jgi:hypothetical protein
VFEVIRAHGGTTAWADKQPAYEILDGPSGTGVQDLYTPEVNSNDPITGQDTRTGSCSIQRNDVLKVQAVLNEINGLPSTGGTTTAGVPTIFGRNFQVGQRRFGNNRTPDFIARTIHGLIDAHGTKLTEHGGFFVPDDRNVALLASNPPITAATVNDNVETRQMAATILSVLGINPKELEGARKENSKVLPGL